jgi:hypothetical protein
MGPSYGSGKNPQVAVAQLSTIVVRPRFDKVTPDERAPSRSWS